MGITGDYILALVLLFIGLTSVTESLRDITCLQTEYTCIHHQDSDVTTLGGRESEVYVH